MKFKIMKAIMVLALVVVTGAVSFANQTDFSLKHPKLSSHIVGLVNFSKVINEKLFSFLTLSPKKDMVTIVIILDKKEHMPQIISRLESLGIEVEAKFNAMLQVSCSPSIINTIADWPEVKYIRFPHKLSPHYVSEALDRMYIRQWHAQGYHGEGMNVAVIDSDFSNYSALVGSELPPASNLVIKNFSTSPTNTGHGTACAELIYDIAPGLQRLFLVTANTDIEVGEAVDWLLSQGIQVISLSAGFDNVTPGDGTGFACDFVRRAAEHNILWVNSAGNEAGKYWQGYFSDPDEDNWHNFTPYDGGNSFYAVQGEDLEIRLTWNKWPVTDQDYDLFLYRENGNGSFQEVASSENLQAGEQEPLETISYHVPQSGNYAVFIRKTQAAGDAWLRLLIYGNPGKYPEYRVDYGELTSPADSPDALAVGAVSLNYEREYFSSRGPTLDGRIKPDICAPDGVTTSTYGYKSFYGTSASAAQVAGTAALLLSASPYHDSTILKTALITQAYALSAQPDNNYGHGLCQLIWSKPHAALSKAFASSYHIEQGNDVRLTAVLLRGEEEKQVDLYAGVILPDGNILFFQDIYGHTVETPIPIFSDWTISTVWGDTVFTQTQLKGSYVFGVVLVSPGESVFDSSKWVSSDFVEFVVD